MVGYAVMVVMACALKRAEAALAMAVDRLDGLAEAKWRGGADYSLGFGFEQPSFAKCAGQMGDEFSRRPDDGKTVDRIAVADGRDKIGLGLGPAPPASEARLPTAADRRCS